MKNVRKFVAWEIDPLSDFKDTTVYKIMDKLNNGQKLTKDEKDWVFNETVAQGNGNGRYKLMGYEYDFSGFMNVYVVKSVGANNHWFECCAFNKAQIREYYKSDVGLIVDITKLCRR